jgi:hypothetical protein
VITPRIYMRTAAFVEADTPITALIYDDKIAVLDFAEGSLGGNLTLHFGNNSDVEGAIANLERALVELRAKRPPTTPKAFEENA